MYLFSRRVRLAGGNTRKAMELAVGITEKLNQITSLGASLYTQVWSPEVGTLAWSSFVPDLATLEAANDKLLADDAFVSMIDKGAELSLGPPNDTLMQVVHGEPDPNRHIEYAVVVQTVCANGKVTKGLETGVEIAQRAERITGTPMLFCVGATGPYGGVGWVSGFGDVHALETAQTALTTDTSFADYIDREAGSAYIENPLLTRQEVYRRIV